LEYQVLVLSRSQSKHEVFRKPASVSRDRFVQIECRDSVKVRYVGVEYHSNVANDTNPCCHERRRGNYITHLLIHI